MAGMTRLEHNNYRQTEHVHEETAQCIIKRIRSQVGGEQLTITLERRENTRFLFVLFVYKCKG